MEMSIQVIKIRNILTLGVFQVPLVPIQYCKCEEFSHDVSDIFFKRTIYGVLCFMKNYNIVSKETCESNSFSGMLLEYQEKNYFNFGFLTLFETRYSSKG
jgi:hypothetical protein